MSTETVLALAPEIVLVAVAVLIYIAGSFVRASRTWSLVAIGGIVLAAALLATSPAAAAGSVRIDALADYIRWLALGAGGLLVLSASRPGAGGGTPEYVGSLLLAVAGVMVVAVAADLVLLFVGLELISIPTYILLYLGRRDAQSQEATLKYFYLSILASAILLYGFSFLYGASGSTELAAIHARLAGAGSSPGSFLGLAGVGLVLVFGGLAFKITAVPFQFYAPDVYQGTTHANAALLSVVPKIAGLVALVRLVGVTLGPLEGYPWQIAMALAILSMTFGNVMALWQNNVRRLLAYSAIAHAGYMLIGLSVYLASTPVPAAHWDGVGALLLYLTVYALATVGTFAALACLGRGEKQVDAVEELAGLGRTGGPIRPLLAWSIAVFMFSLAGIPPMAGFWGKLAVFASALTVDGVSEGVRIWFAVLAVIGVLNAAVSAAYYLRIVGVMFFRMPLGTPPTQDRAGGMLLATLLSAGLVVYIGLDPGDWLRGANDASPSQTVEVKTPAGTTLVRSGAAAKQLPPGLLQEHASLSGKGPSPFRIAEIGTVPSPGAARRLAGQPSPNPRFRHSHGPSANQSGRTGPAAERREPAHLRAR